MPASAHYLVEDGRATGPHSLAVLRQKAEIHVLRPDSLVCPVPPPVAPGQTAPEPAWIAVRDLPELHAALFPAPAAPALRLGQTQSVNVNAREDAASAPVDVSRLLQDNVARDEAAARRQATPEQAAVEFLAPRTAYRPRRRRDYLVCATGLTLFCAVAGLFIGYVNPFLIGLFVMGHAGLAWVLYGVMDPY